MNRRGVLLSAAGLAACSAGGETPAPADFFPFRSVNLGNALEAPNEGEWGFRIEATHLPAIAAAGFNGVRLPVRWDAHASGEPPFAIEPAFMGRVEQVAAEAIAAGLPVQLDLHHFEDLIAQPDHQRARFLAIWRQIAEAFSNAPDHTLSFEPLNEPYGDAWDGALLSDLQRDVIGVIRESNPTRKIVLGPGNWQSIDALSRWRPPEAHHIGVSVHYYEPHDFTHQRAEWLGPDAPTYPRRWGTTEDVVRVREHVGQAARWGQRYGFAMQLGEFGANARVPLNQRAAWTRAVREACDHEHIAWCVWDFAGAFPIYDRQERRFMPEMLSALFGQ